jgi:hypothetical protein
VNFRILATTQKKKEKKKEKKKRRKVVVPDIKPFLQVKMAHSCHIMREKKDLKSSYLDK